MHTLIWTKTTSYKIKKSKNKTSIHIKCEIWTYEHWCQQLLPCKFHHTFWARTTPIFTSSFQNCFTFIFLSFFLETIFFQTFLIYTTLRLPSPRQPRNPALTVQMPPNSEVELRQRPPHVFKDDHEAVISRAVTKMRLWSTANGKREYAASVPTVVSLCMVTDVDLFVSLKIAALPSVVASGIEFFVWPAQRFRVWVLEGGRH